MASVCVTSRQGWLAAASQTTLSHPCRLAAASSPSRFAIPLSNGLGQQHHLAHNNNVQSFEGTAFLGQHWRSWCRTRPRAVPRTAVVTAASVETSSLPTLNALPLVNYINQQGRIQPPLGPKTAASVFAVFDKNKKIQYIGFSKDVRNSLRTLMGRRPDMCYYFKLFNLDTLDQDQMLKVRQQWMSELGLSPPGNLEPVQRSLWEKPGDAGSISERGRSAAGSSMAKAFLQTMADRGLKEEMVYDPALLEAGKCDVLPSKDQSTEEIAEAEKTLAEAAARRKSAVVKTPSGVEVSFEIYYANKIKTNGGWMYDILVSKDDKETRHRVVVGRIYPEAVNIAEDLFLERVIGFLLHKKLPRHTEGLLSGDMFPINYFSVSEVSQRFDDFQDWFQGSELPDSYWRFNRIHSYGAQADPPPLLGPAYSSSEA